MSADCYCDFDPPTIYRRRVVRARKVYRCEECTNRIQVGEQHEYVFSVYDGYADQFRTCSDCTDLRTWVKNNVPCFCWCHGSMRDDAREAIDEATWRAPDETRGLRFGFLRLQKRQELNRRYTEVPFS